MRTFSTWRVLVCLALLSVACRGGSGSPGQISPVAKRPVIQEVSTSLGAEATFRGRYELLPANVVRVKLAVPVLTELDVYQNGALLTRVSGSTPGAIAPGTYKGDVASTTSNTTANWVIALASANASVVHLGIRNRSANADFLGRDRVSETVEFCVAIPTLPSCVPRPPLPPPPPPAVPFTAGVDCMCSQPQGMYVAPVTPTSPTTVGQSGWASNSPNNIYRVQITPAAGNMMTLEVTQIGSAMLVLTQSITGTNLEFSFSFDDARFSYAFTSGGNRIVRLFNLATPAERQRLDRSLPAATQVFAGFSPSGKYFVLAQASVLPPASGGTGYVEIFDATTMTGLPPVYQSAGFAFSEPASSMASQFPPVVWGFSPKVGDRFVYSYKTSSATARWTVVNLATAAVVLTTDLSGVSLARFSPCGDVLALVNQTSGTSVVTAYRTRNGSTLGPSETFNSVAAPVLQCLTVSHTVAIGSGPPRTLGVTTAAEPHC